MTRFKQDEQGNWWWRCDVCAQAVQNEGPWCDLYCEERNQMCMHRSFRVMCAADAHGDGPLVNGIVWDMRARYGINGPWW